MALPLDEVCCASFPAAALTALSAIRVRRDVVVLPLDDHTWVWWRPGDSEVVDCVLALPGVRLYVQKNGFWHHLGHQLPSFDVPERTLARPLHQVLTPSPVEPKFGETGHWQPCRLTLVRDERPRSTTALRCQLHELGLWAETATTAQLSSLKGAHCGGEVLLLGSKLPAGIRGERFWGGSLLVPLGFRPEPGLPESALCDALGIGGENIAVLTREGTEILPRNAFQPLTRAGMRLALQERI